GNIITRPLSSTVRSLALACAVKGGKEIAIIGHTDCQVARATTMQLLERFKALGVDRDRLPDNLNEFFGMVATELQNVSKACEFARQSPLIGPNIPVHGLLADIETGKLDWVVNGYERLKQSQTQSQPCAALPPLSGFGALKDFTPGEMKFPVSKIGDWVSAKVEELQTKAQQEVQKIEPVVESAQAAAKQAADLAQQAWTSASQGVPPKIPLQWRIRPQFRRKQ
ncbi:MAG: hypothetical protein ACREFR_18050, partial [Limisphaerales bacterium]